ELLKKRIYERDKKKKNIQRFLGHPNYTFYGNVDVRDLQALDKVFFEQKAKGHPVTTVVHLAALAGVRDADEDPTRYLDVDVIGTSEVFKIALKYKVKHVCQASSSSIYGGVMEQGRPSVETDAKRPITMYAVAKEAVIGEATSYRRLSMKPGSGNEELLVTTIIPFTVWGPRGRIAMSIRAWVEKMAKGETIDIFAPDAATANEIKRNFTHVYDMAQGYELALVKPKDDAPYQPGDDPGNRLFNIGGSENVGLMDVIYILDKSLKEAAAKMGKPYTWTPANIRFSQMVSGDVKESLADLSRARKSLGFEPTMSMDEGLRELAVWYLFYEDFKKAYDAYDRLAAKKAQGYTESDLQDTLALCDTFKKLYRRGPVMLEGFRDNSEFLVALDYLGKTYQLIGDISAQQTAKGRYKAAAALFGSGNVADARTTMREGLSLDVRYRGLVKVFTDEDIDDILRVETMRASVISTGCFIEDRIFMISMPAGWNKERLARHLSDRYGASLNALSLLDETTPDGQAKIANLQEDLAQW
ncbi:MAG: NAD-dependent epimerase/dehydratase family protein, partial [Candidatus Omnitrophica bacterium]|nr:NAD-dependent epimerase/dehydratase family protein [Candidatus Omnitrophota bacterium]